MSCTTYTFLTFRKCICIHNTFNTFVYVNVLYTFNMYVHIRIIYRLKLTETGFFEGYYKQIVL